MKKNNSTMNALAERMKNEIKTNSNKDNNFLLKEDDLKDIIDFSLIKEISPTEEINSFLKDSTIKLFNIQSKSAILLGEVFSNVFDKLGSQGSENGLYEKWLSINNYNRSTAWRYRQRYVLYDKVNESKKQIIATLPYNIINELMKENDLEGVTCLVNDCSSKDEILEFIKKNDYESQKTISNNKHHILETFEIKELIPTPEKIDENLNKLNEKEKFELQKYLEKINKILNK